MLTTATNVHDGMLVKCVYNLVAANLSVLLFLYAMNVLVILRTNII